MPNVAEKAAALTEAFKAERVRIWVKVNGNVAFRALQGDPLILDLSPGDSMVNQIVIGRLAIVGFVGIEAIEDGEQQPLTFALARAGDYLVGLPASARTLNVMAETIGHPELANFDHGPKH